MTPFRPIATRADRSLRSPQGERWRQGRKRGPGRHGRGKLTVMRPVASTPSEFARSAHRRLRHVGLLRWARVALEGRTDKETAVGEIMSSPLIVVTPQTTIDECMAVMTDRRIRHLPVVDGGEIVGVVSIGDVVKFKSKKQSFEIQYLNDYITAR